MEDFPCAPRERTALQGRTEIVIKLEGVVGAGWVFFLHLYFAASGL